MSELASRGMVHTTSLSGHREEYLSLLVDIFDFEPSIGKVNGQRLYKLVSAPRLVFSSLDDDVFGFCFISMLRSLFGRKTVGLFIRPQSCFFKGPKAVVKRVLFAVMCRLSRVSIFTIVPYDIDPSLSKVSTGWVHDPQMWDLTDKEVSGNIESELSHKIIHEAHGRTIVSYLGRISLHKGFESLVRLIKHEPDLRKDFFFVAAGSVDKDCIEYVKTAGSMGIYVVDRFIAQDELLSLYSTTDMVWCCYDQAYDQASGVFGRCIQFGKVPIVRLGSVIQRYGAMTSASIIAIDPNDLFGAADQLRHQYSVQNRTDTGHMSRTVFRDQFVGSLRRAL